MAPAHDESHRRGADGFLDLALDIGGSLDARTVVRRVLERGARVAAADRATLSSMSEETLRIEASVGPAGELTWIGREFDQQFLIRQPLVKRMLELRETVLGGSLDVTEAAADFRQALARVQHTALVPILDDSRVVGMIVLSRFEGPKFDDEDRPRLTALGAVAGLALRNAKLYEQVSVAARRSRAAISAAAEVGTARDLASLLRSIIAQAAEAAGAQSASVMRLEGGMSVMEATSGVAPIGSRWPMPTSVLARLADGQPVEVDTRRLSIPEDLHSFAEPYDHALILPLLVRGDSVGVLVLGRATGEPKFEADDIAEVQQFASLAALLLSNARLLHQVRESARMKREFLDIAVHELRAPLAVIDGYVSLLQDGSFGQRPDLVSKGLNTIAAKSREARELADGLLTLARIDSDELRVSRDRLSGRAIVEAAVERVRPSVELGGGSIKINSPGEMQLFGDSDLIGRILDNLFNNAVSYTTQPPTLDASVREAGGCVEIRVRDRGTGIADDDRERIFDRFVRGSGSRIASGSGLGLYVSRECARLMGGDLVLESTEVGAGSVFRLTLPSGPTPDAQPH